MRTAPINIGIAGIGILLWSALVNGQGARNAAAGTVGAQGKHQARLKWKPPGGPGAERPRSYIIYRTNGWIKDRVVDCGKKWQPIATTAPDVTEYTDEKVKPGEVYCYAVSAVTSKGESPKSFAASAAIPSP